MRKNSGRDNKKNKEQIVQSGRVDLKAGYRCTLKDEKTKQDKRCGFLRWMTVLSKMLEFQGKIKCENVITFARWMT